MTDTRTHRPRLALFDLDHTLLPLDSDYEWGEFTIRIGWNDPWSLRAATTSSTRTTRRAPSMCKTTCALPPRLCASAAPMRLPQRTRSSCAR